MHSCFKLDEKIIQDAAAHVRTGTGRRDHVSTILASLHCCPLGSPVLDICIKIMSFCIFCVVVGVSMRLSIAGLSVLGEGSLLFTLFHLFFPDNSVFSWEFSFPQIENLRSDRGCRTVQKLKTEKKGEPSPPCHKGAVHLLCDIAYVDGVFK